jgi:hypothetical protein
MEVGEFQVSLSADAPKAEIRLAQQALWWAGKGAWEQAHECIQQRERNPDCQNGGYGFYRVHDTALLP